MKMSHLIKTVSVCIIALVTLPASAVTIQYSSTGGSQINLIPDETICSGTAGCFEFTPTTGTNIEVDTSTAVGLTGLISGRFAVGAITSTPLGGGLEFQNAPVSGSGSLMISDGSANLTASLTWVDISSIGNSGSANLQGSVNLTGISYSGTNSDLQALAAAGSGIQTATFQVGGQSLTDLFSAVTATTSSFSGDITAVPVPAAVWLFGSGLLGLAGVARRIAA